MRISSNILFFLSSFFLLFYPFFIFIFFCENFCCNCIGVQPYQDYCQFSEIHYLQQKDFCPESSFRSVEMQYLYAHTYTHLNYAPDNTVDISHLIKNHMGLLINFQFNSPIMKDYVRANLFLYNITKYTFACAYIFILVSYLTN